MKIICRIFSVVVFVLISVNCYSQDWALYKELYQLTNNNKDLDKAELLLNENKEAFQKTEYGQACYNCFRAIILNNRGETEGEVIECTNNAYNYFKSTPRSTIDNLNDTIDVYIRMMAFCIYTIYHIDDDTFLDAIEKSIDIYEETHIFEDNFIPTLDYVYYSSNPSVEPLIARIDNLLREMVQNFKPDDYYHWAQYYYHQGISYLYNERPAIAITSFEKSLAQLKFVDDYINDGYYYTLINTYTSALLLTGNYEKASSFINDTEELLIDKPKVRHSLVILLGNFASCLYSEYYYDKALYYYKRAESLCDESCPQKTKTDLQNYIATLESFTNTNKSYGDSNTSISELIARAMFQASNGNNEQAIIEFQNILNILKPQLNEPDNLVNYANACNALGNIYYNLNMMQECESTFLEGISVIQNVDINSFAYRNLLRDLSNYYSTTNNTEQAINVLNEAKYLYEKNGDIYYNYHTLLFNMAQLYLSNNDYLSALILYDIYKDYLNNYEGEEQRVLNDKIILYNYLSFAETRMCMYDEAESHLSEAIQLCDQNDQFKKWLPSLYKTQSQLILRNSNDNDNKLDEALGYMRKAYAINNEGFFLEDDLAIVEYLAANDEQVNTLSLDISQKIISSTLSSLAYMSTSERENIWNLNNLYLQKYNYFLLHCNSNAESVGATYDNVLFSKGLLLRTSNFIGDEIMRSKDNQAKMQYQQVQNLYSQLLDTDLPGDSVRSIRSQITTLEKLLSSKFVTASSLEDKLVTSWKDVRSSLGKNEVAIEFAVIPEFKRELNFMFDSVPTYYYYAFINSKKLNSPIAIRLCEESQIKELMDMDADLTTENRMRNRYTNNDIQYFHGRRLYELIWQPIDSVLEENSTIYFSPAGLLNSIAMVAINDGERCLIQKYDMHQVSTTAQVSAVKKYKRKAPQSARIYGGIVYDVPREQMIAEARRTTIDNKTIEQFASPTQLLAQSSTERGGRVWSYLPHSLEEAQAVYSYLKESGMKLDNLQYLDSIHATEESFKAMSYHSPDVIQISTHGFFASDSKTITETHFLQQYQKSVFGNMSEPQVSPMMRSGVIMAGGNGAWTGKQIVEGIEDGILTAEEVSRLNLSGTELVTLSACQSGLGEVSSAEGVFGLQRGFKMAGVKTLIVSLWKVNDATANEFMQQFYTRWLAGDSKAEAFKKAQMAIKEKHPNPYFWAPFIMID